MTVDDPTPIGDSGEGSRPWEEYVRLARERIERAVEAEGGAAQVSGPVAFHMSDWLHDLHDLLGVLDPDRQPTDAEVREVLMAFLLHVPEHVAAAAKLYLSVGIRDTFGLSVCESDDGG
ncbi:MAG: hypothetical protein HND58_07770 [Planctomycetota bacterium]|nr:MAG: hypothetical protein HND58_07770 [Planctomycetota bacterium]